MLTSWLMLAFSLSLSCVDVLNQIGGNLVHKSFVPLGLPYSVSRNIPITLCIMTGPGLGFLEAWIRRLDCERRLEVTELFLPEGGT